MKVTTGILLAGLAVSTAASASEVKLRCVATNGYVRFVTFDERAGTVLLGDDSVEATIGKNEIVAYRQFSDGDTYTYKIDRTTGEMNVWNVKSGAFDSAYKCGVVRPNQF